MCRSIGPDGRRRHGGAAVAMIKYTRLRRIVRSSWRDLYGLLNWKGSFFYKRKQNKKNVLYKKKYIYIIIITCKYLNDVIRKRPRYYNWIVIRVRGYISTTAGRACMCVCVYVLLSAKTLQRIVDTRWTCFFFFVTTILTPTAIYTIMACAFGSTRKNKDFCSLSDMLSLLNPAVYMYIYILCTRFSDLISFYLFILIRSFGHGPYVSVAFLFFFTPEEFL